MRACGYGVRGPLLGDEVSGQRGHAVGARPALRLRAGQVHQHVRRHQAEHHLRA